MKFTYTYRSSDGERHTAEIEAESRDAAFAKIRTELGIKPIKVVAEEDGSGKSAASPNSSARTQLSGAGGSRSRATVWRAAILAAILLVVLGGVVWWMRSPNRESQTGAKQLTGGEKRQRITSEAVIVHVRKEPLGDICVDINRQTTTLQQSDLLFNGLVRFGVGIKK